ncbi:cytochrome D1 domain-containing protein [Ovoidimarina sediminis]|uniref:cytochrome D1 domain-containing protein n=1 Tax=Ovoidimarina sediminis TaxID=3079856 RepID=UPI002913A1A1|nr:cytochrome D1 domain-containing protein [Rhodophyticola sp. MJ-SS7]MDU8941839.1 cytochrome D1 domain-containing protein [Rhodophyticola sp. MJ-SS7]
MTRNIVFTSLLCVLAGPLQAAEPEVLFATHYAVCHGDDRLGGAGPALIPEALSRLRGEKLQAVIAEGRAATQMPAFGDQLSAEDIAVLAAYLHQPLPEIPLWDKAKIESTRVLNADYTAPDAPQHGADPMNLFVVVETGDHHISILDGDRMEVMARLETPLAVHGGPKFSPDGRFVFVMSRDGWVQKVDLWSMQEVGRIRAGVNSRNIAMSQDGKWLAVANYLPMTLTILATGDLSVAEVKDIAGKDGTASRVSAVYQAPPRESFVLALKDVPEIWEVFYGENPPFHGFVHDYRDEGPLGYDEPFPVRRITLKEILDDFFFSQDYEYVMGASRDGEGGQVVDLVIGHTIAELELPGMPHLGSGITWERGGQTVMATPHLRDGVISVIDMKTWETVKTIGTEGPGFFLRSHEETPYLWADVFFGPNRDVMHVIDKESLEIVKTLRPAPGRTAAHVEFDRYGRYALVSLWEQDGAVIVYDAATLQEVKRLPMVKPSGKYNVHNKITFSAGTSH